MLKERDDLEVSISIRSVLRGGAPIDPFIARRVIAEFKTPAAEPGPDHEAVSAVELSQREQEVLTLVAGRLSNREIADQLNISRHTVESHVKHIYRKLAVSSRIKAISAARSLGILN